MTTKSPPSTCGANVALCLPRSRVAAVTARRPRTTSLASMTCQFLVISSGLGLYVDTVGTSFRLLEVYRSVSVCQAFGGCRARSAHVREGNSGPDYRRHPRVVKNV